MTSRPTVAPVTIIIEWENAIDVEDEWTAKAMTALQAELERSAAGSKTRHRVVYLYDDTAVDPAVIRRTIAASAPRLGEVADVEVTPTHGLTYYKLKNFGVARSTTELTVMLDSDAAPQPGWLENLLKPFADPEIMVVGGFTVLGFNDLLSKTMALSWIFDLPDERKHTVKRAKVHVNNCAVRTDFFNNNPFPDLPIFKKQCGFWLRDFAARGHRYVRTADAMTIHAPHPGVKFLVWRAWTAGSDRDYQVFQENTQSRIGRIGHAFQFLGKKTWRAWSRIWTRGSSVDLPVIQRPVAMLIAFIYYSIATVSSATRALTQSYQPLPPRARRPKLGTASGA
ncbi:MAG: glycosyltransferase [Sphingomicrobium sp.]